MAFKPYKKTTFNNRPIIGNSDPLNICTIDQPITGDHLTFAPCKRRVVALIDSGSADNHVTAHQQPKFPNVSSPKTIRDIDLNSIPVNEDGVKDSSASTPILNAPRPIKTTKDTALENNCGPETKRVKLNSAGLRSRSSHNNHFPALNNNNNINNVRYFGLSIGATNTRGGGGGLSLLSNPMMCNQFSDPVSAQNFLLMSYPNRTMSSVAIFGGRISGPNPPSAPKRCQWCLTTYTPLWRNGPHGLKTLCNACGIRFFKEQKKVNAGVIKKIHGDRI